MANMASLFSKFNIKDRFSRLKKNALEQYSFYSSELNETADLMKRDKKEKNRIMIMAVSAIFVIDYAMFSYHINKNIFNIFPSIPVIETKDEINIYIPSEGCREILSEKREINLDVDEDILVKKLTALVAEGSYYENTSSNVPVKLLVKNVWITADENGGGKICLIDLSPVILDKDAVIVTGSEKMFRESLEKTIRENVKEITGVILLEQGVPNRKLWEI